VLASDADGDLLTAVLVSGPSHGSLTLNTSGSFVYAPAAGYSGPDSFSFEASDGIYVSTPTLVSLTVTPPHFSKKPTPRICPRLCRDRPLKLRE